MAYEKVNWENLPSTNTPVNADNLNKMDEGIANAVEKTGDTLTGSLNFNNKNDFEAIRKTRTLNGTDYQLTVGLGENGSARMEYITNDKVLSSVEARSDGIYNGVSGKKLVEEVGNISLTTTLIDGNATAYRVGNIVIVTINGQKNLPSYWTNYDVVTLSGVTAKKGTASAIVDQDTGLCADMSIDDNSNVIKINKRGTSSITGRWLRGQLIFLAN